ncbi:MAG: TIGR03915 family putative DNA repair protein [Eggerthellaceae bacterium]
MQPASSNILDDLGNPIVFQLVSAARSTMNEWDRLRQFIRFEHRVGDVWFARCNPRASVVPLLMPWFVARFNTQRFVIYDETHHLSGVWDGKKTHLVQTDEVDAPPLTIEEPQMQQAWIAYWNHITISERYNPELQRQNMPKRLWRNITEVKAQPEWKPDAVNSVHPSHHRQAPVPLSHRMAG